MPHFIHHQDNPMHRLLKNDASPRLPCLFIGVKNQHYGHGFDGSHRRGNCFLSHEHMLFAVATSGHMTELITFWVNDLGLPKGEAQMVPSPQLEDTSRACSNWLAFSSLQSWATSLVATLSIMCRAVSRIANKEESRIP